MASVAAAQQTIAIVGSAGDGRPDEIGTRDPDRAREAAAALGRELASRGLGIVVYSSDPKFIEADVVRGYVSAGAAQPRSIQIRRPREADGADFAELESNNALFDPRPDSSRDWEVSFYRSLFEAGGVLLIGGGRSTLTAGLIALANRTPVVTLADFGGNAAKVWDVLDRSPSDALPDADEIARMGLQWSDELAAPLVDSLVRQRERRAEHEASARKAASKDALRTIISLIFGLLLFLAALACIPLAGSWSPGTEASLAVLIGAPVLAAAAGAIVRHAFDEGREWVKTAVLGMMVGGISSLLFIAAQLLTTPGVLESTDARRLLFFVVPVGFIAGLTFDDVYRKLRGLDVTKANAVE
jgi:hypothetical protein